MMGFSDFSCFGDFAVFFFVVVDERGMLS